MLLSLLLAWGAAVFTVLAAAEYFVRKYGSKKLRRAFSRSHKTFGVLLLIIGLVHGILAGNAPRSGFSNLMVAPVLFTWNWGTGCLIAALLLALSYVFRRRIGKKWMPVHRLLTVLLAVMLVLHVVSVGIHLDDRVRALLTPAGTEVTHETSGGTQADSGASDETEDDGMSGIIDGTNEMSGDTQADSGASDETENDGMSGIIDGTNETFSGAVLQDGTYRGTANGYYGPITVSVVVSGGQVTDITVLSESETSKYFSRAENVLDTILSEQSLEVDAVSGATFSSAGLINAVDDALQSAVVSGELAVTEFDLPSGR